MKNYYLYLYKTKEGKIEINACDGVFSSFATFKDKEELDAYCDEKVNLWLKSNWGNFDGWSLKDRNLIANKWLAVKSIQFGEYKFYFNLENLEDLFRKEVKELAKNMGISYKLEIKN